MPIRHSMLVHGLLLTLRRLRAVLWTYAINLGLALLFSLRLFNQYAAVTAHSLAAQRLTNGFDLGALLEVQSKLNEAPGGGNASLLAGIPLFVIFYFLLVPGTLFCYRTEAPARLSTVLHSGLHHFWRFVRIAFCTLLVALIVLGPLMVVQSLWSSYVDDHFVGRPAFLLDLAGIIIILLVAAAIRLYFDFVEVYTVELGLQLRSGGRRDRRGSKPDRRIRKTFGHAFRTLSHNFGRAYGTFVFLTLLGNGVMLFTARIAMHQLAQPRVGPMFLLAQSGLFFNLFTRFWQRGAETILAIDRPLSPAPMEIQRGRDPNAEIIPPFPHRPLDPIPADPIPDPEPASPSLTHPDPGVYHHEPGTASPEQA
jgi:hypothetical protein